MKNFNWEDEDYDDDDEDDDLEIFPRTRSGMESLSIPIKEIKEQIKEQMKSKQTKVKPEYLQWSEIGENSYFPIGKTLKKITPGVYRLMYSNSPGAFVKKQILNLDELFELPQEESIAIMEDIRKFWERKESFEKYNYTYKRGILLYGPPGNGKSSIVNLLASEIITKHKGIVVYVNNGDELFRFQQLICGAVREIQPETPVLCVFEDLEVLAQHNETELLNLLDGAGQMSNVVFLGCTNYPEKLKERIINRPSRFDRRYLIKAPSESVRKIYFEKKLTETDLKSIDLDHWVKETKDLSLAHLGDLVKSVFCLGNDFEEVMKKYELMKQNISSTTFLKDEKQIGFSR